MHSATARCAGSSRVTGSRGKKTAHANERNRPDVLKKRHARFEAQPDLEPARLVFIDETWAKPLPTEGRLEECIELSLKFLAKRWKTYKN